MNCPKCGREMEEAMAYNIWVCSRCKKSYTIYGHEEKVGEKQ